MGLMWVPQEVIHLKDLGLDDWPRTALGKLSKLNLRKLVRQRYHDNLARVSSEMAIKSDKSDHRYWRAHVLSLWARAVRVENETLDLRKPISDFADSLTVARVRGQIRREVPGWRRLSTQNMAENETVAKQIGLVLRRLNGNADVVEESEMGGNQTGPPDVDDVVHLTIQPDKYESTKQLVTQSISKDGFNWDDVQDVFPAQGFVSELPREAVLDSAKFQNAYTTKTTDYKVLRSAIERMLRRNRILASYLVWDTNAEYSLDSDLALHVTLKHDQKLFDHVFQHGGTVESIDELRDLAATHPHPEWTLLPGMLIRVLTYNIKQTGTLGFIYSVSHCIMDATYQARFLGDLNEALEPSSRPQSLRSHASYKLWAESYYSLQTIP